MVAPTDLPDPSKTSSPSLKTASAPSVTLANQCIQEHRVPSTRWWSLRVSQTHQGPFADEDTNSNTVYRPQALLQYCMPFLINVFRSPGSVPLRSRYSLLKEEGGTP